jgi:hypothetical protein
MTPLFFTLNSGRPIMAITDNIAHFDGQTEIALTYSFFIDKDNGNPNQQINKESHLHLVENDDPDYLGYITVEKPGRVYSYTGNGTNRLSIAEIQDAVEQLNKLTGVSLSWSKSSKLE